MELRNLSGNYSRSVDLKNVLFFGLTLNVSHSSQPTDEAKPHGRHGKLLLIPHTMVSEFIGEKNRQLCGTECE